MHWRKGIGIPADAPAGLIVRGSLPHKGVEIKGKGKGQSHRASQSSNHSNSNSNSNSQSQSHSHSDGDGDGDRDRDGGSGGGGNSCSYILSNGNSNSIGIGIGIGIGMDNNTKATVIASAIAEPLRATRAAFDLPSPLQRRPGGGSARRVAGMDAGQFGVSPWMDCRQTPQPGRVPPGPTAREARKRGGLSLGYFSLATQREVTRPPKEDETALGCCF